MKTRRKIYEAIVREQKIFYETIYPEYTEDKGNRLANITAVHNTERMYQMQFTKKIDKARIIELLGNGQNIHGICTLMKMEKEEVIKILKGK